MLIYYYSDVRAELSSLHPNAMTKQLTDLPYPRCLIGTDSNCMVTLYDRRLDVSRVLEHFRAQSMPMTLGDSEPHILWRDTMQWAQNFHDRLQWDQSDSVADVFNQARWQAKLYGRLNQILRPFLRWAIYYMDHRPLDPLAIKDEEHDMDVADSDWERLRVLPPDGKLDPSDPDKATMEKNILWACKWCIFALMKSTAAFDCFEARSKPQRPRVPNVHAFATA